MSGQDVGFFDVGESCPDLIIENGDLKPDNGLETPALISLFSDRRVTIEQLPPAEKDRKGWWADLISEPIEDLIGSRLWSIERSKVSDNTAIEIESMLNEAFQWMIDDGIAASIIVNAEIIGLNDAKGTIQIFRPSGDNIPFKFIWDGQSLKLME